MAAAFSKLGVYLGNRVAARPWIAEWLLNLSAWGVPFVVYLRTLAPTVYGLDSAELTTGAYTLGIIHAPGSPTYLLIGHLFTALPFGDVGYRLNLLSACCGASTALFLYRILLHLTGQKMISLATAWFAAFTYYFWISAAAAELYALTTCFAAGLIWLALEWRVAGRPVHLYLFAFLYGLGLGTHAMLILFGPGLAWLVSNTPQRPWRQPRMLLGAALCGLLGVSVYLYLPIRYLSNTPFDYARTYWGVNLATWDGFWWMVTARMFGSLFFGIPLARLPGEALVYAYRVWSNFLGLGLMIGLVGLLAAFKRWQTFQVGLLLMLVGHLTFYLPYAAADKDTMFQPTFLIWAIWVGLGFDVLRQQISQRSKETSPGLAPALAVLLVVSALVLNFGLVDLSHDWRTRQLGEAILVTAEPQAYYFGTWGDVPILEYLQLVEGQRPDVTPVNLYFTGAVEGSRMAFEKLAAGFPVYTSVPWLPNESVALERIDVCQCFRAVLRSNPQ
jgi:hypothetical protein